MDRIYDFRVYNRALTTSEIYAMYSPATRWELYRRPDRVFKSAAVAAVSRSFAVFVG